MFVKENLNPQNKRCGDCVVRAIAKTTGMSWIEVHEDLCEISKKLCTMPNDKETYQYYLFNFMNVEKIPAIRNKKRLTVKDVSEMKGTYLVRIAHHLTAVKDGNYYDTWDCGKKCAYMIWKVN